MESVRYATSLPCFPAIFEQIFFSLLTWSLEQAILLRLHCILGDHLYILIFRCLNLLESKLVLVTLLTPGWNFEWLVPTVSVFEIVQERRGEVA